MQLPKKILDTYESFVLLSETDFLLRKINNFDNNIPLIIYDVTNEQAVNEKIKKFFGNPEVSKFDNCLVIKAVDFMKREVYSFGDLVEIIKRLRDPDGCPWDRAQTNKSIRENAVEEAYELVEAIDMNDDEKMVEEAGDVLLQGLFNAVIAEDENRFSINDVISGICKKLVFRHTHIFGDNKAENSEDALKFWEQAKAVEKGQKTLKDKIDSVPKTFGALMRALKVQKIIKKTGFEFPSISEAEKKVFEEIEEFQNATDAANREEEGGDLLFSVVNILRMNKIDPELALNATTEKFIKRFAYVEENAIKSGKKLEQCTLEEMESWYQQSKQLENR